MNDLGKPEFVRAPETGDEREMLEGFLASQRSLVQWKLAGASDEDLLKVSTSTGLTARGVLNHLTHVERWWWREVFDGQEALEFDWTDADPDGELHLGPEKPLAQLLAEYADECSRCDAVLEEVEDLDQRGVNRDVSARFVVLHLIEETARHLGHLDLLRELADGSVGVDPSDNNNNNDGGEP